MCKVNKPQVPKENFQDCLDYIELLVTKAKVNTSYKFALLLAIAKLCKKSESSKNPSNFISYKQLTDEFMTIYRPHIKPFITNDGQALVIKQTSGSGGVVVLDCLEQIQINRQNHTSRNYESNIKKIQNTIIKNPVAKLQIIDGETIPLLYDTQKEGIILKAGWVGFLQKHYDKVTNLVQNAFMDYILSLKANKQAIHDRQALQDFLFGHYLF